MLLLSWTNCTRSGLNQDIILLFTPHGCKQLTTRNRQGNKENMEKHKDSGRLMARCRDKSPTGSHSVLESNERTGAPLSVRFFSLVFSALLLIVVGLHHSLLLFLSCPISVSPSFTAEPQRPHRRLAAGLNKAYLNCNNLQWREKYQLEFDCVND